MELPQAWRDLRAKVNAAWARRDELREQVREKEYAARRAVEDSATLATMEAEIQDLARKLHGQAGLPTPHNQETTPMPSSGPRPARPAAPLPSKRPAAPLDRPTATTAAQAPRSAPRAAPPPPPPTPRSSQSHSEDRVTMLLSLTPLGREALRRRQARRAVENVEASTLKERRRRELLATSPLGRLALEREWRNVR